MEFGCNRILHAFSGEGSGGSSVEEALIGKCPSLSHHSVVEIKGSAESLLDRVLLALAGNFFLFFSLPLCKGKIPQLLSLKSHVY